MSLPGRSRLGVNIPLSDSENSGHAALMRCLSVTLDTATMAGKASRAGAILEPSTVTATVDALKPLHNNVRLKEAHLIAPGHA
jgi:hypothetical protein